ncbi:MAG: YebC/PmpR family DNA-binding transcriptional regulator [Bacteroidota bacterium]
MSGHSKWSTIKHKKGATDAKRSKAFSKVLKDITVAVREGGADRDGNPRLRVAIANAKGVNMPKDNIERAIKKASDRNSANLTATTYEGYAPGGIAIFIECLTDNVNRTISNIRAIFTKGGGNLGTNGSLEFLFDKKGIFTIPTRLIDGGGQADDPGNEKTRLSEDDFYLEVIDGGAEDVVKEDDIYIIYTSFEDFGNMQRKLEELGVEAENAELQRIPKTTKTLDIQSAQKVLKLIEAFDDDDDVQNVFHNLEMTDELMAEIG